MNESYMKHTENSSRQPFNVANKAKPFRLQPGNVIATIYYGLIFCAGMGLFAYVNSYFLVKLSQLVNQTNFSTKTSTQPNCNNFFCNQAMYNVLYDNSFYQQCNYLTCQATVCTNYNCTQANATQPDISKYYNSINAYYTCYPKCLSETNTNSSELMAKAPVPQIMNAAYGVGIAAAVIFGVVVLIAIVVGFLMAIINKQLSFFQKIGLMLWVFFPGLKYYAIRQRTQWRDFNLNTKALVICDFINTILLGFVFAMYIFQATLGLWLSAVEVVCFFFVMACYLVYFGVIIRNARVMYRLQDSIREHDMAY